MLHSEAKRNLCLLHLSGNVVSTHPSYQGRSVDFSGLPKLACGHVLLKGAANPLRVHSV